MAAQTLSSRLQSLSVRSDEGVPSEGLGTDVGDSAVKSDAFRFMERVAPEWRTIGVIDSDTVRSGSESQ